MATRGKEADKTRAQNNVWVFEFYADERVKKSCGIFTQWTTYSQQ